MTCTRLLRRQPPKLFADDTNIFLIANNLCDLSLKANECLNKIQQWCQANRLTINLDKTNFTVFSPKRNLISDIPQLFIGNTQIKYTTCCKYLGMMIDNRLDWLEHIDYTYKKLIKFCSIFYKIRDLLPFQCLKIVYYSFVHPIILYGVEVYANTYNSYLNRLSTLNNKIIRILFSKNKQTHITELYEIIESLPIIKLHEYSILKFVYNCVINPNILPEIFKEYFSHSNFTTRYSSRRQFDLYVNQFNSIYGRKCLKNKGCALWNNVPNSIRSIPERS